MTTSNRQSPMQTQQVTGLYHNVPFSGDARDVRADWYDNNMIHWMVDLDSPITVYGSKRSVIEVVTNRAGYSGDGTWIKRAA